MNKPLIPGGYILLSRKIIEDEIWDKPPLYLKVWIYLLSKAQHKRYRNLDRGELHVTIPEIQEACSWYVGYRKETPTRDQVYNVINWMRNPSKRDESRFCYEDGNGDISETTMITTTRTTRGLLLNIGNYDVYQNSKNYESNTETNDEKGTGAEREPRGPDPIYKNDKNARNKNDDDRADKILSTQTLDEINILVSNKLSSSRYENLLSRFGEEKIKMLVEELKRSFWLRNNITWNISDGFMDKVLEGDFREYEDVQKPKSSFSNFEGELSSMSDDEINKLAEMTTRR